MTARTHPFQQGLAEGLARYQRCQACGHAPSGQRLACPRCGQATLAWCDAAGGGTVAAASTVHRAPDAAFAACVPYTLVLVDLDEGPRLMGHGEPGLAIGQRVTAGMAPGPAGPLLLFRRTGPPA